MSDKQGYLYQQAVKKSYYLDDAVVERVAAIAAGQKRSDSQMVNEMLKFALGMPSLFGGGGNSDD